MKNDLKFFADFLSSEKCDNVCFACHVSPDGDTVASAVALASLVRARGRRAFVSLPEEVPASLSFLFEEFENAPFEPSVVVAVDTSTPERLGNFPYADRVEAVIDHHLGNSFDVPVKLVDSTASATGILVLELYEELGEPLTDFVCRALYTALSTDTGRFCHSNADARSFSAAARLCACCEAGHFAALNRRLFVEKNAARLALEGYVLSHVQTEEALGLVFFVLTQKIRKKFALEKDADLGSLVDVLRTFAGFDVAVLAKETEQKGIYKLSVRTEGAVGANEFCARFGGGGHARAAGATVEARNPRALYRTVCAALSKELSR